MDLEIVGCVGQMAGCAGLTYVTYRTIHARFSGD